MLSTLRKNTKKIIWLIIIAFCMWGAFSVSVQFRDQGQIAGRAFGSPVPYQEFNKLRKATEILSLTGERVQDPGILHQLAWQNVIFAREAKRRKLRVSDDEVREQLEKLLDAQKIPSGSPKIYESWVRSASGVSPREFEEMLREMIRIQKLLRQVQEEADRSLPPEAAAKKDSEETQRKRTEYFVDWNIALLKRAKFEDLMPQPALPLLPEPSPAPSPTPPPSPANS